MDKLELSHPLVSPADMFEQIKNGVEDKKNKIKVSKEIKAILEKTFLEISKEELHKTLHFFCTEYDTFKWFFWYKGNELPDVMKFEKLELGHCKKTFREVGENVIKVKAAEEEEKENKKTLEENKSKIRRELRWGHGVEELIIETEMVPWTMEKFIQIVQKIGVMEKIYEGREAIENLRDLIEGLEKHTWGLVNFVKLIDITDTSKLAKRIGWAKNARTHQRLIEEVKDINKVAELINEDQGKSLNGMKTSFEHMEYNQVSNLIWALNNDVLKS